jgi:hypothetical protein
MTAPVKVVCAPWCSDGDGHPNDVFREDQRCYSPFVYVFPVSADGEIGAHARRDVDKEPVVELHVYGFGGIDETIHFTAIEAVLLAERLLSAAVLIGLGGGW